MPVDGQEEQILQDLLRQKLNGSSEISPLPSGELMDHFLAELMILNDEVTNQREGLCNEYKWNFVCACHLIIKGNFNVNR